MQVSHGQAHVQECCAPCKLVQCCTSTCGKPLLLSSCGRSSQRPRDDSRRQTKAQSSQPVSTAALHNPAEGLEGSV